MTHLTDALKFGCSTMTCAHLVAVIGSVQLRTQRIDSHTEEKIRVEYTPFYPRLDGTLPVRGNHLCLPTFHHTRQEPPQDWTDLTQLKALQYPAVWHATVSFLVVHPSHIQTPVPVCPITVFSKQFVDQKVITGICTKGALPTTLLLKSHEVSLTQLRKYSTDGTARHAPLSAQD